MILLPKEKLKGLKEFRKEIAEHWYRIVGSNDEKHLRAGTEVSPIESSTGIIGYMASYMAKEDQTDSKKSPSISKRGNHKVVS